jgi:hypothetical protein
VRASRPAIQTGFVTGDANEIEEFLTSEFETEDEKS